MLTNNEIYEVFCRDRCKYMVSPTLDILDRCADCPISRLTSSRPWYSYPESTPPPGTVCLLVNIERSTFRYAVGECREKEPGKCGFFSIYLPKNQLYPNAWQPIEEPKEFLKKGKIGG